MKVYQSVCVLSLLVLGCDVGFDCLIPDHCHSISPPCFRGCAKENDFL